MGDDSELPRAVSARNVPFKVRVVVIKLSVTCFRIFLCDEHLTQWRGVLKYNEVYGLFGAVISRWQRCTLRAVRSIHDLQATIACLHDDCRQAGLVLVPGFTRCDGLLCPIPHARFFDDEVSLVRSRMSSGTSSDEEGAA